MFLSKVRAITFSYLWMQEEARAHSPRGAADCGGANPNNQTGKELMQKVRSEFPGKRATDFETEELEIISQFKTLVQIDRPKS